MKHGYEAWIREVEAASLKPSKPGQTGSFTLVIAPSRRAPGDHHCASDLLGTLQSIEEQTFSKWSAVVMVESSQKAELGAHVRDPRLQVVSFMPGEDWRARAWNLIEGKADPKHWLGLIHPGDRLHARALDQFLARAEECTHAGILFSDEDELEHRRGKRFQPWFKPDFDPESLMETRALGSSWVVRTDLVRTTGGCNADPCGSDPEQDLFWRLIATGKDVEHIHQVLLHRAGPVAHGDTQSMVQSAKKAATLLGRNIVINPGIFPGTCEVRPAQTRQPRVSVMIPNRDQAAMLKDCTDTLFATGYPNLEILIVENGSREQATHDLYRELEATGKVRILPWTESFNYSGVNNHAARNATGELLLLLNNDVTATDTSWLTRLVEQAQEPGIGAVGPTLLYPDGRIQHAGCVFGVEDSVGHRLRFADPKTRGYGDFLAVTRQISAVTGACLMVTKKAYFEVGGMDEYLGLTFNDIDFCLKLTRAGLRNIYLARASLIHHECVTRGQDLTPPKRARMNCEMEYFVRKWGKMAEFDPFHSPYLTSMFNTLWLKPGIPSLNRGVPQMPTIQAESKNVAA
jgi:GT2 family glycosyltransferase